MIPWAVAWQVVACQEAVASFRLAWNSPGKNTGMDSHSLLQGSSQGLNPSVLTAVDSFLTEPPGKSMDVQIYPAP